MRHETNLLVGEIKVGNIGVPFVLDIMVVKDVRAFRHGWTVVTSRSISRRLALKCAS
jgi:hypothetical protein